MSNTALAIVLILYGTLIAVTQVVEALLRSHLAGRHWVGLIINTAGVAAIIAAAVRLLPH